MSFCDTVVARPNGLRPWTCMARRSTDRADGFAGLPDGITRWRLAAALRAAARLLDLGAPMLRLLEHYIDCTYDIDWTAGNEPVITRPLTEIATCLGRSERQIRNLERGLAERGLLIWRDSGNHHRRGQRDRNTGRLLHAYGPSLAPMAARAHEIVALAERARTELAEMRRTRLAIGALRRRLRCTMTEVSSAGEAMPEGSETALTLTRRLPARLSLQELDHHRDTLRRLVEEAENVVGATSPCDDTAGQAEIRSLPTTDTATGNSLKKYVNGCGRHANGDNGTDHRRPALETTLHIETVRAAAGPTLKELLVGAKNWQALTQAAERSSLLVGIDSALWREGCARMGGVRTALAILVMEHASLRNGNDRWPPLRNPAAYFRGIMKRHADGTLHLERSVRRLARDAAERGTLSHQLC